MQLGRIDIGGLQRRLFADHFGCDLAYIIAGQAGGALQPQGGGEPTGKQADKGQKAGAET